MDHAHMFMRAAHASNTASADVLMLPRWAEADWTNLLTRTTPRRVGVSEIIISRGVQERCLYFTVAGEYEVGGAYIGGISLTTLARIPAGSVFGEQSFFDALPRSANVWAHAEGELLVMDFAAYEQFALDAPALARDLSFALARILSLRLRNTTIRVH
ncbi:MAG: cyclic nucleotide-binding domain-containing protein [Burkholderiales bacterium]|nr:cyclic nucleotide-binding domain-containing protein [Burkholderiales bacterium]